jgi:hypothetical protein
MALSLWAILSLCERRARAKAARRRNSKRHLGNANGGGSFPLSLIK